MPPAWSVQGCDHARDSATEPQHQPVTMHVGLGVAAAADEQHRSHVLERLAAVEEVSEPELVVMY